MLTLLTSSLSGYSSKTIEMLQTLLQSGSDSSNTISNLITEFTSTYGLIISILALCISIMGCFFGYKVSRMFMSLSGFIAGSVLGCYVAIRFMNGSNGMIILAGLIGGILFSILAYKIYQAGIFLLCFFFSFVACANLLPVTDNLQFFLCTAAGFIVGALALKYVRPVIILTSAIGCAYSAATNLFLILPDGFSFVGFSFSKGLTFIVLAALGLLIQFVTTAPAKKKK